MSTLASEERGLSRLGRTPGTPPSRRLRSFFGVPGSLKVTVPLILLVFAAALSMVNLLYHAPAAEREAVEDSRKRLVQELSRLQSTLEYLLLKGDVVVAQHEIAVLAHNHDVLVAALTDDRGEVIAATRRAWLGRPIAEALPQFDLGQALTSMPGRRSGVTTDPSDAAMLGYASVLVGSDREELRPSRTGNLFLAYDLKRYKAEARAHDPADRHEIAVSDGAGRRAVSGQCAFENFAHFVVGVLRRVGHRAQHSATPPPG